MKIDLFDRYTCAEVLRASHISRWGIVQTSVRQNVAEHQYRVWVLARHVGPMLLTGEDQQLLEELALSHDLPEIRTGDNPTSIKSAEYKAHLDAIERSLMPSMCEQMDAAPQRVRALLKYCDTVEAILFLSVNGLGEHARSVTMLLERQMIGKLEDGPFTSAEFASLMDTYHELRKHT